MCSNICAGMVLFADNILTSWLLFFFWSRQDMYGLKSEQTIECWRWKFQLVAINLTMMSIKSKKNETRLRISLECSVNKFDVFWAKKPEKFASCRFIVIFDLIGHVSPKNSKSRTFHWAINLLSLMSLQKKIRCTLKIRVDFKLRLALMLFYSIHFNAKPNAIVKTNCCGFELVEFQLGCCVSHWAIEWILAWWLFRGH